MHPAKGGMLLIASGIPPPLVFDPEGSDPKGGVLRLFPRHQRQPHPNPLLFKERVRVRSPI